MTFMRLMLCATPVVFLAGCMSRPVRVPVISPAADAQNSYIDLQPGWRLRVVTPLTKSGAYKVAAMERSAADNTITLSANDDFIGYQTAYYSVQGRNRTGVRIEFASAEDIRNGVASTLPAPSLPLFQLSRDARYVRLLYLARKSQTDHNMAVLAAKEQDLLNSITSDVQGNPALCQNARHIFAPGFRPASLYGPSLRKSLTVLNNGFPHANRRERLLFLLHLREGELLFLTIDNEAVLGVEVC